MIINNKDESDVGDSYGEGSGSGWEDADED